MTIAEKAYSNRSGDEKRFYAISSSTSLNNIKYIPKKMVDLNTATDLYFRSLQTGQKENYLTRVSTSAFNIGPLYKMLDEHDKADDVCMIGFRI